MMKNQALHNNQYRMVINPKARIWAFFAGIMFTFSGMSAGLYIVWGITRAVGSDSYLVEQAYAKIHLFSIVLLMIGFLAIMTKIHRPSRMYNIIRGLRVSWMSREAVLGALFLAGLIVNILIKDNYLIALNCMVGLIFVYSQGMILALVTHLGNRYIPFLFILSSLVAGSALLIILFRISQTALPSEILMLLVIVVSCHNPLLYLYHLSRMKGIRSIGLTESKTKKVFDVSILAGMLIVTAVFAYTVVTNPEAGHSHFPLTVTLLGVFILFSYIYWKFSLISEIQYGRL
jgi:DMSO reductase anchor subunit